MTKINIVVAAQTNSAIQGLNEVTQATKRTGDGVRRAQKSLKSFGGETSRATMMTRKFAMGGLQQAGYQIGDYAVQVANGTSKMQAFGQQAPQLLQIFGPLGAIVGAGVAIFAAFGVAAEKSGRSARFFAEVAPAFDNFADKMSALVEAFKPLVSVVGVAASGAFRLMGNMMDFASDNLSAFTAAAAAFVAVKLGVMVFKMAKSFVSLAKSIMATNIIMRAFNATVRRSPLALLAVVVGFTADRMGLLEEAMDSLKKKFPEFFEAVSDAGKATSELITSSFSAIDSALRTPLQLEIGDDAEDKLDKIASSTRTVTDELRKRMQDLGRSIDQSMEGAFMSVIDGTKSVKDAFRSMASEIIKELYRVFVVKRITGLISGAIGGYFNMNQVSGPAMPLGTGNIRPPTRTYAGGGYTGNGARAGGLDGKGGFMAMMHPRETVVDHTKGQSMGGVTVIQNNTFGSGVSRAEVNAMLPKMVEATKAAVADAKLRGGSYGRSFA